MGAFPFLGETTSCPSEVSLRAVRRSFDGVAISLLEEHRLEQKKDCHAKTGKTPFSLAMTIT